MSGDIIVKYQEQEVSAEKEEDLNKFQVMVSQSEVGKPAALKIVRDGVLTGVTVEISVQPKVKADEFETEFGFTVKEITDAIYRQHMLEDKEGVLVSFVEVGGVASMALLDEGDIIKKVEEFEVKTLEEFEGRLEQLKDTEQIMLTVKRGKNKRFILLLPEKKPTEARGGEPATP